MTGGAILLSVTFVGPNPNAIYMVVFLVAMFILLLGIGVALPNCLSLALVDFQDVIGTAGALFSLGYYSSNNDNFGNERASYRLINSDATLFSSYSRYHDGVY